MFKPGYLGRSFFAVHGSRNTRRQYDFGPILAAAKLVESGWMPAIEPPDAAACNRSEAEATCARDCNRHRPATIATGSSANEAPRLQPVSAPRLQPVLPPDACNRFKGGCEHSEGTYLEHRKEMLAPAPPEHALHLAPGFALKGCRADVMRAELLAGEAEAIAVALKWTGEVGDKHAENTFRKLRRMIGCMKFAEAVLDADAEARAGEEPRNRGAALVARMKRMIQPPPEAVAGFSAKMGVASDA